MLRNLQAAIAAKQKLVSESRFQAACGLSIPQAQWLLPHKAAIEPACEAGLSHRSGSSMQKPPRLIVKNALVLQRLHHQLLPEAS